MRIAITGSTGLIGAALVDALVGAGHDVVRLRRSRDAVRGAPDSAYWDPARGEIDAAGLEGAEAVIHLAGEPIAGLWTRDKKWRIRESRVRGTDLLSRTLARLDRPPRVLLSASGVNYYGDRDPDEPLEEVSPPGTGFMADVAQDWEAATAPAAEAGIRVVRMRTGVVLSARGGMLGALLPLFRLGLGGRVGSGRQVVSWIALDDVVGAALHVLGAGPTAAGSTGAELSGPVNFVSPGPVTNAEFVDTLGRVLGRPTFLALPAPLARLAPGDVAEELLLASQRAVPRKLLDGGYRFAHPGLEGALRSALGADGASPDSW